jgi:hypothetical protein
MGIEEEMLIKGIGNTFNKVIENFPNLEKQMLIWYTGPVGLQIDKIRIEISISYYRENIKYKEQGKKIESYKGEVLSHPQRQISK